MTVIISHRGNLNGPNPSRENHPDYIGEALKAGFPVEIDVWGQENDGDNCKVWLGHDGPQYEVPMKFITIKNLFIHCKNIEALWWCKTMECLDYFFHDKDDAVLTSNEHFWTYPNSTIHLTEDSIPVIFNRTNMIWDFRDVSRCYGICTDDALYYDALFNHSAT